MKLLKLLLACLMLCAPTFGQVSCLRTFSAGLGDLIPYTSLVLDHFKHILIRSAGHTVEYVFNVDDELVEIAVDGTPFDNSDEYADDHEDASSIRSHIDNFCGAGFAEGMFGSEGSASVPRAAASSQPRPAGHASKDVALVDFNGDKVLDSAVLAGSSIFVTLRRADGTTLSSNIYRLTGISVAENMVSGDFNGDGVVDLATTQGVFSTSQNPYPTGNVLVLLGNRDGTFQSPLTFPVGSVGDSFLASADFNGDGVDDLAMTHRSSTTSGSVAVMLGKKDGSFGPVVDYPVGPSVYALMAGDFNRDGKVDVLAMDAFGTAPKVWVLPGKGDGTFSTAVSSPTNSNEGFPSYTDLNQDGIVDLVIADFSASAMEVMMGKGDGTFQAGKKYLASSQPTSIGVIPLFDGNTSLFMADNDGSKVFLSFISNDGVVHSPELQAIGTEASGIAAGDLNGDGFSDLAMTDSGSGKLYVKLSTGKGVFANPVPYSVGVQPGVLAIADVNGDGKQDVLVVDRSSLNVLLNQGGGTFGNVSSFPAGGTPTSISVADFNGDGKPDVAGAVGDVVAIFLGNGNGTFQSVKATSSPKALGTASGDFNGDGKQDLVVTNGAVDFQNAGNVSVLLGNGDGTFRNGVNVALSAPLLSNSVTAGDLNGDGKLDVVTTLFAGSRGSIAVLLGKGDGTFQAPTLVNSQTAAPMIAITDLNGDKKADLVLSDCCGLSEASFMLGYGDGTFQSEVLFPSGPDPVAIAVGDFDGNGKPDLAIYGYIEIPSPHQSTLAMLYNVFAAPPDAIVTSSADRSITSIAPGSLATIYGTHLAVGTPGVTPASLPTSFGGTSVAIVDAGGKSWQAQLLYVSAAQVNFLLPAGVATGPAHLTITSGEGSTTLVNAQVAAVAPGLFVLNSVNLVAATGMKYSTDGTQQFEQIYSVNGAGAVVANPIDLGSGTDQLYLSLYGTGLQAAGTSGVQVNAGGYSLQVAYAGTQGFFPGLDQVNVVLPHFLVGSGDITLQMTANGVAANIVRLTIK